MTFILCVIVWLSAAAFLIGCAARVVRYARAPMHLRWELYPVPHEEARRASYGGSYFEQTDWWTRPRHFRWWGEARFMAEEIFLLKGVREFNRKLWFRSLPFHLGLYLIIVTLGLLAASAALNTTALHAVYTLTGGAGGVLLLAGALSLLIHRLTNPELRLYTTKGDLFHLSFFVLVIAALGGAYALRAESEPSPFQVARALLTFNTGLELPPLQAAGLMLGALLAAYIPLTQMSHFLGKYFTYHAVRWDDAPAAGSRFDRRLQRCLAAKPSWRAPHVGADGSKSWAEVATANPWQKPAK